MRFSEQIFKILDLIVPALAHEGRPHAYDPEDPETLRAWLVRLWYLIRASVPLMETASDELASKYGDQAFTSRLVDYFNKHIEEERDHDDWLLEDLVHLGCDPRQMNATMAPPSVAALAGSQYYYIRHHHPIALLGYFVLGECYPFRSDWVDQMQAESPAPPEVWRTLRFHGKEDMAHRLDLIQLLDAIPAEPALLRQSVLSNAIRTAHGWAKVLEEIGPTTTPHDETLAIAPLLRTGHRQVEAPGHGK